MGSKTNNGQDLKSTIEDPVDRLEILIDGNEDLGVKGLRWRVGRIERYMLGLMILGLLQLVILLGTIGTTAAEASGLLAPVIKFFLGG